MVDENITKCKTFTKLQPCYYLDNKHIFRKVNIIPVIGKADSCTPAEIEKFKTKVITVFKVVEVVVTYL